MLGIENVIVGLWFLPVTLFIIVPLVMFAVYHIGLVWACRKNPIGMITGNRKERVTEPGMLQAART